MTRDPDGLSLTKKIRLCRDPETLARAVGVAVARLLSIAANQAADPGPPPPADRLLKAHEAARMFGVSRSWLYEHGDELGLARRPEGLHGVRFSEQALRLWQEGKRRE